MRELRYCALCGTNFAECEHHLLFGRSQRKLATADNITIDICNKCHNTAEKKEDRIHDNPRAEDLSKMLGQALWELDRVLDAYGDAVGDSVGNDVRNDFIERYGRSYL